MASALLDRWESDVVQLLDPWVARTPFAGGRLVPSLPRPIKNPHSEARTLEALVSNPGSV